MLSGFCSTLGFPVVAYSVCQHEKNFRPKTRCKRNFPWLTRQRNSPRYLSVFASGQDTDGVASPTLKTFPTLVRNQTLLKNIADLGFVEPLPIQATAIPVIAEGGDAMLSSYTGSGKTLAFLLPLLEKIDPSRKEVQLLIIEPTRELAVQVANVCEKLLKHSNVRNVCLIGGANVQRQISSLKEKQPQVVIGTPGRMLELSVTKNVLNLRHVFAVVLDEIDQCLEDVYVHQLESIVSACVARQQTIFCSATCDSESVLEASKRLQRDPVMLGKNIGLSVPENIQHLMLVSPKHKHLETLKRILFAEPLPTSILVFVNDQHRVGVVANKLKEMKLKASCIQGNSSKIERAKVLKEFRERKHLILVSTEVLARGMDFPFVSHVIQLELATDAQHYLHRAGRCGRAGIPGFCFSIVVPEHRFVLEKFSKTLKITIRQVDIRNNRLFFQGKPLAWRTPTVLGRHLSIQEQDKEDVFRINKEFDALVEQLEKAATWDDIRDDIDDTADDEISLEEEKKEEKVEEKKKETSNESKKAKKKAKLSRIAKLHGWVGNRTENTNEKKDNGGEYVP
eukprot:jgi/Galph1/5005/GphlegSOOS_G3678.1